MAIGSAQQKGSNIYAKDEKGFTLFQKYGELKGYTSSTLTYQAGPNLYTCNERGQTLYTAFAEPKKTASKTTAASEKSSEGGDFDLPLPIILVVIVIGIGYNFVKEHWSSTTAPLAASSSSLPAASRPPESVAEPVRALSSDDQPHTDTTLQSAREPRDILPRKLESETTELTGDVPPPTITIADAKQIDFEQPEFKDSIQKALDRRDLTTAWRIGDSKGWIVTSTETVSQGQRCRSLFISVVTSEGQTVTPIRIFCKSGTGLSWTIQDQP